MTRKIIRNKDKGILFFITGLSGSGKTSIAKKIQKEISQLYGPSLELSGNNFRKIFEFNKFSQKGREDRISNYLVFAKLITDQKINLIYNLIGMYKKFRTRLKKIDNYVEIYIKADIHKIIKLKKKTTYLKNKKDIVGLDIKAEFPTNPHITIINDFNRSTDELAKELLIKLKNLNLRKYL